MRLSVFRTTCVVLLALLSVGITRASAQFETASVVGTVRDASGAVVPDATVTLTSTATGVALTRTTTADGTYEFVTVKSGINTVTPGEMVTLTYTPSAAFQVSAITNDFSGANNYRPNLTCDLYAPAGQQSITNWFNASCVALPTDPSQPFGNASRNNVRGPNFWQVDLAASKSVPLGGPARLQVRVEAFNLLNRVNFTPPASNRSASNFGTITSTFDARQVQLGVKVLW